MRRQHDAGFFKSSPYPAYPFLMLPELGSPYLPNGALSPGGARTVSGAGAGGGCGTPGRARAALARWHKRDPRAPS